MWNDREDDHFVCHILDIQTRIKRTIPFPIYCVSPDGLTAMSLNFERIQHITAGYGYAGVPDPYKEVSAPENSGIYKINLATGKKKNYFTG